HDADLYLGLPEPGAFAHNHDVGRHGQFASAPDADTAHGGQHRFAASSHRLPDHLHVVELRIRGPDIHQFAQVRPGGEDLFRTGDHDRTHVLVLVQFTQHPGELDAE